MKNFYGTFGSGQPLAKYCIHIIAEDMGCARLIMETQFSSCWCSVYEEKEKKNCIDPYNYIFLMIEQSSCAGINRLIWEARRKSK